MPRLRSPAVMSRCAANSLPLSVVMVFKHFLYAKSFLTTAFATGPAFLPCGSFYIITKFVRRSTRTRMAWPWPSTMWSISKSPKRLPSASAGRSCMLVRPAMLVALTGFRLGDGRRLKLGWRQFRRSSPLVSALMML